MLVLSRRSGESVIVGNDIVVTVIEVRGEQVRIGIDAPREVQVHREEVYRQLEAENAAAAGTSDRAKRLVARMPANAARPAAASESDRPTPGRS